MNNQVTKLFAGLSAAVALSVCAAPQQAEAGTLYQGWNYSIDSHKDGSGGAFYELKGLAITETEDNIVVAITGGYGKKHNGALGKHIGFGDLMFNFTGDDFQTANQTQSLFGIRFDEKNDSGVSELGVYSNVQATGVTQVNGKTKKVSKANRGYNNLNHYYTIAGKKFDVENTQGSGFNGEWDLSEKEGVYDYYGQYSNLPVVMTSGTKIGSINMLSGGDLFDLGLDFAAMGVKENTKRDKTFGFEFDKNLFGDAAYLAHLFFECGNDGIAIDGEFTSAQAVPEAPMGAGFGLLGLGFAGALWNRNRKQKQVIA